MRVCVCVVIQQYYSIVWIGRYLLHSLHLYVYLYLMLCVFVHTENTMWSSSSATMLLVFEFTFDSDDIIDYWSIGMNVLHTVLFVNKEKLIYWSHEWMENMNNMN